MKKAIFILITIILIISMIFFLFFYKKNNKLLNMGNTMSNQSAEEIEQYILNMKSYFAELEITVKSNKNENKYKVKQEHILNSKSVQEVLEPSNIKGLKMIYEKKELKIENSSLNLSKIYKDYQPIGENNLFLDSFIQDYKNDQNAKMKEQNDQIILETNPNKNKYVANKKLIIDRKTGKPIKMEINDTTQNMQVYILYNKIEINNLQEEDVLAFHLNINQKQL